LRDQCVTALEDFKAVDIRVLDVRQFSSWGDYLIIASGTSSRHVAAMADRLQKQLRQAGHHVLGVEGRRTAEWVLLDYGEVVVHLMRPAARSFYDLEGLWGAWESLEQAGS